MSEYGAFADRLTLFCPKPISINEESIGMRVFKIVGIVLGSLVGIVLLAGVVLYWMGNARLNKVYDFPPPVSRCPKTLQASNLGNIVLKLCARAAMART